MKSIFDRIINDLSVNSLQSYIEVFLTIVLAFIIKRFISKYLAGLIYRIFSRVGKNFRKQSFLDLIINPLETFLFIFIIVFAFDKLTLPNFLHFNLFRSVDFKTVLQSIVDGILIITFIRLCIRLVKFIALILQDRNENDSNTGNDATTHQLIIFFQDFFKVFLIIVGGLLVLHFSFHYRVSNFLTGLSLVVAAIALATKESLENLIASFIIFFDKPFTTGDTVKVQGFNGVVEKIGLRSTRIRTDHKTFITVPNKQMVDTILDNITLRTERRVDISLEIGLSATSAQLKAVAEGIKEILQLDIINSSTVYVSDTGKNAHIITVLYFTSIVQTLAEFYTLRQNINLDILDLLKANNVELAAASTDIVVSQKPV